MADDNTLFPLRNDVQGAAAIFLPSAVAWPSTLARDEFQQTLRGNTRGARLLICARSPDLIYNGRGPQEVLTWKHAGRGISLDRSQSATLFFVAMTGNHHQVLLRKREGPHQQLSSDFHGLLAPYS